MTEPTPAGATAPGQARKIAAASLGNFIEWYDFYIFNIFAPFFAMKFSAASDPTGQFLDVFGVYALGFVVRPVGAFVLCRYADARGRRAALIVCIALMCAGSAIIAAAPTVAAAGIASPLVLLLARILQGFSLGGEYAIAGTYVVEVSEPASRGLYSSLQSATSFSGQLLAAFLAMIVQRVLTVAQIEAWGWRIPFALGAAAAIFCLYLRRHVIDSDEFMRASRVTGGSRLKELRTHWRRLLVTFGITIGATASFYTLVGYMPTFLFNTAGFAREQATAISLFSVAFLVVMQPLFGALSDRVGRKPCLLWFGIMGTLFLSWILSGIGSAAGRIGIALPLLLAGLLILSGATAVTVVVRAELFPAPIRAFAVGIPYALAASIFGGSAPYVALWLLRSGRQDMFFRYVAMLVFVSLVFTFFLPETRHRSAAGPAARSSG